MGSVNLTRKGIKVMEEREGTGPAFNLKQGPYHMPMYLIMMIKYVKLW